MKRLFLLVITSVFCLCAATPGFQDHLRFNSVLSLSMVAGLNSPASQSSFSIVSDSDTDNGDQLAVAESDSEIEGPDYDIPDAPVTWRTRHAKNRFDASDFVLQAKGLRAKLTTG